MYGFEVLRRGVRDRGESKHSSRQINRFSIYRDINNKRIILFYNQTIKCKTYYL